MLTQKPTIATIVAIIAALLCTIAVAATADLPGQPNVELREGRDFAKRLTAELSGSWSGVPLANVTTGLSRTQRVAVVLDRRVDPTQPVSLHADKRPLREILAKLASEKNLEIVYLGPVVYMSPAGKALPLRRAGAARREDVHKLPPPMARLFRTKATMAWDELTTPRSLLLGLCRKGGLTVVNPQRLPHDLWAAAALPSLALSDRLSFILGQFDLTYEILPDFSSQGPAIRLVPITIIPPRDDNASQHEQPAQSQSPPQRRGRKTATGAHSAIRIERFSVSQAPLEPLLKQLAARLDMTLQIDRRAIAAAGIDMDDRVSLSVADVTVDELFAKLLNPLGLAARRDGKTIRIGPQRQSGERKNLPKR